MLQSKKLTISFKVKKLKKLLHEAKLYLTSYFLHIDEMQVVQTTKMNRKAITADRDSRKFIFNRNVDQYFLFISMFPAETYKDDQI